MTEADSVEVGMLKNKIELLEEDLECVHMYLDQIKAPREGADGTLSIVGRIKSCLYTAKSDLNQLEVSRDFALSNKVWSVLETISKLSCKTARILGGDPCGKCPVCLIKPLEKELFTETVLAGRRNREDSMETYWQALYAIRCSAEHTSKPKKALEAIRDIERVADEAIKKVKGMHR